MSAEQESIRKCSLIDELAKHRGKTVYIGSRSSFFFVGPAEEALASLGFLSLMLNRIAAIATGKADSHSRRMRINLDDGDKLGKRKVLKVYDHDMCGGETCIIIEGREFGMFWTRSEYLAQKKILVKALEDSFKTI